MQIITFIAIFIYLNKFYELFTSSSDMAIELLSHRTQTVNWNLDLF